MGGIIQGVTTAGIGIWKAKEDNDAAHSEWADTDRKLSYDARQATLAGQAQAQRVRERGSQLIAKQKTAYTSSGIDASSGTALSVMSDTRLMSELDAQTVENDAARKVWGYRLERDRAKKNLTSKLASIDREAAASILNGFGQALGGASGLGGGMGG